MELTEEDARRIAREEAEAVARRETIALLDGKTLVDAVDKGLGKQRSGSSNPTS
ncbi:MAG: hypothetical protein PHS28_05445 [Atopobiaceae bacterium]|jgi:hypothetical protein|nr:hypothetical protein [Atopobiaceae bacterium]